MVNQVDDDSVRFTSSVQLQLMVQNHTRDSLLKREDDFGKFTYHRDKMGERRGR